MRKIKRNDEVVVIAGRDKGKRGEGAERARRRTLARVRRKPREETPARQIRSLASRRASSTKEAPIDISNVAIFNNETGKPDRVRIRADGDKKERVFKSNGKTID